MTNKYSKVDAKGKRGLFTTETETKNISIEHIAKLTKSNDIVKITKTDGDVTIDTSVNKGSDVLKFSNTDTEYNANKF